MAKQKLRCPRIERRKKKDGWNLTIYARNGKKIYPNNNQQFSRWIDAVKSIVRLASVITKFNQHEVPIYTLKGTEWVKENV